MEIENQFDESIASNLSLPSGINNMANPGKHQTSHEHHSAHYSSISNEDVNKDDKLISTYVIPTRSKIMKNNCESKKHGFRTLLCQRSWPNPFVQGG